MDEPLSNVDAGPEGANFEPRSCRRLRAQGATAIYITHDQSEAIGPSAIDLR